MQLLTWIENTTFSTVIRESALLYPSILALHSIGLAFAVGISVMVALAILGLAPGLPLGSLERLYPVLWLGFLVNLVTGLALLAMAATTHLTDPVMYFKLTCIALAVISIRLLQRHVVRARNRRDVTTPVATADKMLAGASLGLWALAVTAGRLTAYTFFRFWS